jgi:ribosomal protein L18E
MSKQITGSTSKPMTMKAGEQQVITIAKGQQLRIQELINGQMKDAGKVMSSRKGKDLQVKFLDGTELVVKDFFEVCQGDACSVTLGDSQLGSFTITADTPLGNQLPDGTHLVHYSLSDASSLMDLAAAGGEFIKTSTATVAQAAAPAVLETAAVAQAATLTGGSNMLWAGLGLALAAGGGGGGGSAGGGVTPEPIQPDGFKGVVWDTPVSKAIVFRDLNGDGIWDANEPITITDEEGKYEGLTGEGNIVATSLDRLLWRGTATYVEYSSVVINNVSVAVPTTKTIEFVFEGAAFDTSNSSAQKIRELIDPENQYLNGGQTRYNSQAVLDKLDEIIAKMGVDILPYITGFSLAPLTFAGTVFEKNSDLVAIDIGANLENESTGNLPSGDDFVWSGTYVIGAPLQDGQVSVYVTAVSTLVKAYMEMNGGTATQALAAIKAGLDFDQSSGTGAVGSNTKILTGELNAQITRLMGEVIARAEAADFSSVVQKSMIDEINATLETLAAAIKSGVIAKIDLTNPAHLFDIFNGAELGLVLNDEYEAQALALQIGATGPATNSVWHTETVDGEIDSNVDSRGLATLKTDDVVGNITVLARHDAQGEDEYVALNVTSDENDSVFLQSSRLRVQASGEDVVAGLGIGSAEGAISDLDILATGEGSLSIAQVEVTPGERLTIESIEVLASGARAGARADVHGDSSVETQNWALNPATLGTVEVDGSIVVSATGVDSSADVGINAGEYGGLTVLGGGDITVTAGDTRAMANLTVNHVSGSVGNVNVQAEGQPEVVGFNFFDYFDADNGEVEPAQNKLFVIRVGDETYEFDIDSAGYLGASNLEALRDAILADFNTQAAGKEYGFAAEYDGAPGFKQGLFVVWDTVHDESQVVTMSYDSQPIGDFNGETEINSQYFYARNATQSSAASLNLLTDGSENDVTMGNLAVAATAESSDAVANIEGFVTIEGHVSVEASELRADAQANINNNFQDKTFLGSVAQPINLSVAASNDDATADLNIHNASGTVGDMSVNASAQRADAQLDLHTEGAGVKATRLTLLASGEDANAFADIEGDVAISGDIQVTSSQTRATAHADINDEDGGSTSLGGGDLSVTASGEYSSADAHIFNASGTLDDILVTASAQSTASELDLHAEGGGIKASRLTLNASGEDANAFADIEGDVAISGDIQVNASQTRATAHADINDEYVGSTSVGGGDLSVTATGTYSSADAHIFNASGTLADIQVTASAQNSDSVLDLHTEGAGVNASSLTLMASAQDANASVDIEGDVAISGDIQVTASQTRATAHADINDEDGGGTSVGGGDLSVTATGTYSSADAHIFNASGTLTDILVTSSGQSSDAELDLHTEGAGVNASSLTLMASAQDANASADIEGDVAISGDIQVTASQTRATAHADINDEDGGSTSVGGGDLSVTASGTSSSADAHIFNASGTLDDILVTASGQSADAALDLHTEGAGINADNLTLLASAQDANAYADIEGDVQISGDIQVTASQTRATAHADINDEVSGETTLVGSDISVTASGLLAESILDIGNASGSVGDMDVTASGQSSDAELNLEVAQDATLTLDSISVTGTDATNADASVYLRGASAADKKPWTQPGLESGTIEIHGDISVSAASVQSDASLGINSDFSQDFGPTEFYNSGDLTVEASATDATAEARILNASGNLGDVTVTATGQPEVVGFDFLGYFAPNSSGQIERGTSFSMDVEGDSYSFGFTDVSEELFGNLTAVLEAIAKAFNDEAGPDAGYRFVTNYDNPQSFATGLFVVWDGIRNEENEVSFYFNGTEISGADYVQIATERSTADLRLVTDNNRLTMDAVTVVADAQSSDAHADLSGVLSISGDISVTAGELLSTASADINARFENLTTLGDEDQAINLTVTASGVTSDADLHIGNASGFVNNIAVAAAEDNANADMTLELTGDIEGDISVSAKGSAADAFADISGDVALTSAMVTVTSNGQNADADLVINSATGLINDITVKADGTNASADLALKFDGTVDGDIMVSAVESSAEANAGIVGNVLMTGGDLTVTTNGVNASADLEFGTVRGTIGSIEVTASGMSADADLDLHTTALTAASLSVTASSVDADASADIDGDIAVTGNIEAIASAQIADAYASINETGSGDTVLGNGEVGSDLTVTASSQSADADLVIGNASGTVGSIDVTATGIFGDADLYLTTTEDGISVETLNVMASSADSDANAMIAGTVDLTGDIDVMASAERAAAGAMLMGEDSITLGNGDVGSDLTITASSQSADADLVIINANGTVGSIDVTASGVSADADLYLTTNEDGITVETLNVMASKVDAEATAMIFGSVDLTGDVDVTASAERATAGAMLMGEDSVTLGNGDVGSDLTVTASSIDADAGLVIINATGLVDTIDVNATALRAEATAQIMTDANGLTVSTISVDASGEDSTAEVMALGELDITGDIQITSSGEDSGAYALLNALSSDASDPGTTTFGREAEQTLLRSMEPNTVGSNITVSATGTEFFNRSEDFEAGFLSQNTRGHVGELNVSSTGVNTDAAGIMGVRADETVKFDSISVNANSTGADNATATVYLYGQDGQATDQDRWTEQKDFVTDHGTVEINGDITVTAEGLNDDVILHVNSGESLDLDISFESTNRGYTVLGGGDITIEATATDASADVVIHNAEGLVGDIALTAGGVPEVLAFDFLTYFDHISGDEIANEDRITFNANGVTLTHEFNFADRTIPATPTAEFINGLLAEVIASFNAQAQEKGLSVHFDDAFDDYSAFADQTGLFAIWDTVRPNDTGTFGFNDAPLIATNTDGSINSSAKFELETENDGVTIRSIAVTASAESADSELDIKGAGVAINGDISVVASELFAFAEADINDDGDEDIDGPTVLGLGNVGSNITVTASAVSSEADLDIEKAQGLVGDIAVTSGADFTETDLELWSNAKGLEAASLTVVADGFSAETDVEIDADANFTITGDVHVTANDFNADADVNMYGKTSAAHFHVQGDITVEAFSQDALAHVVMVEEDNDDDGRGHGQVTLGTDSVGTSITLEAKGTDTESHLHIFSAQGKVNAIDLQSTGQDAWAHLELEAGADRDLSIESMSVRSITGVSSDAEVEMWTANADATLAIKGDVVVKAEGVQTEALVEINQKETKLDLSPTFSDGVVAFGNAVNAKNVGSNITVAATDTEASAIMRVDNAVGTIGNIALSSSGVTEVDSFDFLAYFDHEEGVEIVNGDTFSYTIYGVTLVHEFNVSNFTVPQSPSAEFVRGLLDDVIESFNEQAEEAGLDIHFVSSVDISGTPETALFAVWDRIRPEEVGEFGFGNADLTNYTDNVRHGSIDSYARFRMETEQDGVTIASIAVTTDGQSGEADFDIVGAGVSITGDITVVASEEDAEADVDINDSTGGPDIDGDTVLGNGNVGSKITVTASAYYADADLDIENANGAVGHIEVTASAEEADAVLELWSNAKGLVVDSLTAVANGDYAETAARLDADGEMTIKGEVKITSQGDDADADVEIHAKAADGHLYLQGDITVSALTDTANAELEVVDEFDVINERSYDVSGDTVYEGVGVREEGQVTLGTSNAAINMNVISSGDDAEAHIHIYSAGGYVADIKVEGRGEDGYAHLEMEAGADRELSIESLSVRSITGIDNDAEIELWTAAQTANISVKGNVLVGSEGERTETTLTINDKSYDEYELGWVFDEWLDNGEVVSADLIDNNFNTGTITFGEEVNGETVGSDITVSAIGDSSYADADIHNARGTLGDVTVTSSGARNPEVHSIYAGDQGGLRQEIRFAVENGNGTANAVIDRLILVLDGIELSYDPAGTISVEASWVTDACAAWQLAANADGAFGANQVVIEFSEGDIVVRWLNDDYHDVPKFRVIGQNAFPESRDVTLDPSTIFDEFPIYNVISDSPANASLNMERFDGVIDGNIAVSATNSRADADANFEGVVNVRGNVSVTASGTLSEAYADINPVAEEVIAPRSVLLASLPEAPVHSVFGRTVGDQTIGSDLTVSAEGVSADADLNIGYASGAVGSVDVSATNTDADAYLNVEVEANKTLTVNTIRVEAHSEGEDTAYAEANFSGQLGYDEQDPFFEPLVEQSIDHGTVQINGDITVEANGLNDDATLNVNFSESGATETRLSLIWSMLFMQGAGAWVTENNITTDANFGLYLELGDGIEPLNLLENIPVVVDQAYYDNLGIQVTIEDLSDINASLVIRSENGSVEPRLVAKFNSVSELPLDDAFLSYISTNLLEDPGVPSYILDLLQAAIDSGEIFGTSSESTSSTGHTVLGGGDITITASATGADADAYIYNASGNAGDVSVTSTGVSQAQGFDFLAYFDPTINNSPTANNPNLLYKNDTFVVTLGEHTFTFAIDVNMSSEKLVNDLLEDVVDSLNSQAQAAGLNVTFATSFTDGPTPISTGLFAVWDSIREEETIEVAVKNRFTSKTVVIENNDANADFFWGRDASIDNAAYVEVIAEEGKTLTVASVTVTSETEIAFNEVNEGNETHGAWADFYGNVHVTGNINVAATELNAYAETWMNNPDGSVNPDLYGTTTLGLGNVGSNITVTASGQIAGADAQIHNADGTAGNITVTASGDMIAASEETNVHETQSFFLLPQLMYPLELMLNDSVDVEMTVDFVALTDSFKSWSVMVDGITLSVDLVDIEPFLSGPGSDFDSNDAYVEVLRSTQWIVDTLNEQAAQAGLRVTFDTDLVPVDYLSGDTGYFDMVGPVILNMTWNDFKDHDNAIFGITTVDGSFLSIADIMDRVNAGDMFGESADLVFGRIDSEDLSVDGEFHDIRAEANLDFEFGGTVKGNLVLASANEHALATANLYGDFDFEGDLTITASDLWSDALLSVNVDEQGSGVEFGRSPTDGSDLTVVASGQAATAKAEILKASGTLGNVSVISSGAPLVEQVKTPLNAEQEVQSFDIDTFSTWATNESVDEVGQTWSVTLSGGSFTQDIVLSVSGDWDNSQDLVDSLNDADNKPEGVLFSWNSEDDTVSITYPEGYDFDLAEFKGKGSGKEERWGETASNDVTAFSDDAFDEIDGSSDLVLCDYEATPSVSHVELEFDGTVAGDVAVLASNVSARATAQVVGDLVIEGDVSVTASSSDSFAWLDVEGNDLGLNGNVTVLASGQGALAGAELMGISGDVSNVVVRASAQDADVFAHLHFNDGVIQTLTLDAEHHRSTVHVEVDQSDEYAGNQIPVPVNEGKVVIDGEGHVGMTYFVDVYSSMAKAIDMTAINSVDADGDNHWGVTDLDLVAKWDNNDGAAQAQQTQRGIIDIWPKVVNMTGFNVQRDSINLRLQNDTLYGGDTGADSLFFSSDTDTYEVTSVTNFAKFVQTNDLNALPDEYVEALTNLLADSRVYFNSLYEKTFQDRVGYFYREVTFTLDDKSITHSFMVYDFDVDTAGISGIINFGTTTGLTERNVAERYSIVHSGESMDDSVDTISLDGFHAIDELTVMAGGYNLSGDVEYSTDVTYSLDDSADVMIDDITVTAFEIRDMGDEILTTNDEVSLEIFAEGEDSSLQLRQSEIFVGADREGNTANLEIRGAWGTVSSLVLEATYGGSVDVEIDNDHNLDSGDVAYDHGLIVRDVSVLAAGEDASVYLNLDLDQSSLDMSALESLDYGSFIEHIDLRTLGEESTIEVEIDQGQYGGLVSISGSGESDDTDCFADVGSNEVDLTFWDQTAERIVIDNTDRTVNRFEDNSIKLDLDLFGEDNDFLTDVFDSMLTIEGWTRNDTISFFEIDSEAGLNYQSYTGGKLDLNEENLDELLSNARQAFNPANKATEDGGEIPGVNFYFGTAGQNGYLFYDYDGRGVTGVVEFVGLTQFDYSWLDSNTIDG